LWIQKKEQSQFNHGMILAFLYLGGK